MPKFTKLDPSDVRIGQGRSVAEARLPYTTAIKESDAGRIELERGEKPAAVKRLLQGAAKANGIRLRSSWDSKDQKALVWKKIGM